MARVYHRDANGRFASGGGSSSRPARKAAPTRAGNRINRDNAGKITGIGKDGATARGGRLRTASGNRRATQTARLSKVPGVARKGPGVMKTSVMNPGSSRPAGQGSIAQTLRGTLRALAQADARLYREIEGITGMPLRAPKGPTEAGKRVRGTAKSTGKAGQTMRAGLRELAQGDARLFRGLQDIVNTPKGALGGSSGRKQIGGGKPQLPSARKPRRKKS
jgi:hypothetical protein